MTSEAPEADAVLGALGEVPYQQGWRRAARLVGQVVANPVAVRSAVPSMMAVRVVGIGVSLVSSILIARTLGPYDKGIYNLIVLLPAVYATFLELGTSNGSFRALARGQDDIAGTYTGLLVHVLGTFLLIALPVTLLGGSVLRHAFPDVPHLWVMIGLLVLGPLTLHGLMGNLLLLGSNRAVATYVLPLLTQALIVVGVVITAIAHLGLPGIVVSVIAATAGVQVLSFAVIHRGTRLRPRFRPRAFAGSARFGMPLYVASIFSFLHARVDQLWMASVLRPSALGQYALAVSIGEMLWSIDLPVISALQFEVASTAREAATELVDRATRTIVLIMLVTCTATAIVAVPVISVVYGRAYLPAAHALILYLPAVLFWSAGRSVGQGVGFQHGRTDLVLAVNFVSLSANLVLLAFLLRPLGAAGAALASSGSYLVLLVVATLTHTRLSGSRARHALVPRVDDAKRIVELVSGGVRRVLRVGRVAHG